MSENPTTRAAQAKRILEDDMFKEMVASIEAKAMEQWRSSEPHQAEEREDAYRMLRAIDNLRSEFQRVVTDGTFARRREERKT